MDQVERHLRRGIEVKLVELPFICEILRADKVRKRSFVLEQHVDRRSDKDVKIFFCSVALLVVIEKMRFIFVFIFIILDVEAASFLIIFCREFRYGLEIVESDYVASVLRFRNESKSGFELLLFVECFLHLMRSINHFLVKHLVVLFDLCHFLARPSQFIQILIVCFFDLFFFVSFFFPFGQVCNLLKGVFKELWVSFFWWRREIVIPAIFWELHIVMHGMSVRFDFRISFRVSLRISLFNGIEILGLAWNFLYRRGRAFHWNPDRYCSLRFLLSVFILVLEYWHSRHGVLYRSIVVWKLIQGLPCVYRILTLWR